MPDIVPTTPFADGSAANADTFAEELYQPLNPPGNIEIKMNKDERAMFDKSVDAVKGLVAACKAIDNSLS